MKKKKVIKKIKLSKIESLMVKSFGDLAEVKLPYRDYVIFSYKDVLAINKVITYINALQKKGIKPPEVDYELVEHKCPYCGGKFRKSQELPLPTGTGNIDFSKLIPR